MDTTLKNMPFGATMTEGVMAVVHLYITLHHPKCHDQISKALDASL